MKTILISYVNIFNQNKLFNNDINNKDSSSNDNNKQINKNINHNNCEKMIKPGPCQFFSVSRDVPDSLQCLSRLRVHSTHYDRGAG